MTSASLPASESLQSGVSIIMCKGVQDTQAHNLSEHVISLWIQSQVLRHLYFNLYFPNSSPLSVFSSFVSYLLSFLICCVFTFPSLPPALSISLWISFFTSFTHSTHSSLPVSSFISSLHPGAYTRSEAMIHFPPVSDSPYF